MKCNNEWRSGARQADDMRPTTSGELNCPPLMSPPFTLSHFCWCGRVESHFGTFSMHRGEKTQPTVQSIISTDVRRAEQKQKTADPARERLVTVADQPSWTDGCVSDQYRTNRGRHKSRPSFVGVLKAVIVSKVGASPTDIRGHSEGRHSAFFASLSLSFLHLRLSSQFTRAVPHPTSWRRCAAAAMASRRSSTKGRSIVRKDPLEKGRSACDSCHRRRVRCSGQEPCVACLRTAKVKKREVRCSYTRQPAAPAADSTSATDTAKKDATATINKTTSRRTRAEREKQTSGLGSAWYLDFSDPSAL